MKTKLVCWTGIDGRGCEYEVPEEAKWMVWDPNGEAYWYVRKPEPEWEWVASCRMGIVDISGSVFPPEDGFWDEQLYWIGD